MLLILRKVWKITGKYTENSHKVL